MDSRLKLRSLVRFECGIPAPYRPLPPTETERNDTRLEKDRTYKYNQFVPRGSPYCTLPAAVGAVILYHRRGILGYRLIVYSGRAIRFTVVIMIGSRDLRPSLH
jgi:hypothetical protein